MNRTGRPSSAARGGGDWHASPTSVRRYVNGDEDGIPSSELWALESHLETCRHCRDLVAELSAEHPSQVDALIEGVWTELSSAITDTTPVRSQGRARRWLNTWTTPAMIPWLVMTLLVTTSAVVADLVMPAGRADHASVLVLIAPLVPVLAVAAAWSRAFDPAHELTAATSRAGLRLVLRRTLAVLVVVIPCLALAGWIVGTAPYRWLLPSLAFTAATLALGSVFGITRAAACLVLVWTAAVVVPSLATAEAALVLDPAVMPFWGATVLAFCAVLLVRGDAFTELRSQS